MKPPNNAAQRRMKNLGKKLAAVILGLAFALIALEGGAHLMSRLLGISSYMQYDDTLGWTAKPGATKHHNNARLGFDVTYNINDDGLRGTYYGKTKPANSHRILILGDSNGFGWGVPEGKHFAAILDDALPGTQVLNLSLSGYGTDQQYLRFIKEGVEFDPDLVIVQVSENDFEEIQFPFFNSKPKPQFVLDDGGRLRLHNVPVKRIGRRSEIHFSHYLPVPFKEWLSWHSYAFNFLNERYVSFSRKRRSGKRRPAESLQDEQYSARSIGLFSAIIAELGEKLDEIGAQGVVFHAWEELSTNEYLENVNLPVLDLYQAFARQSAGIEGGALFSDGYHWNQAGHRIIAAALLEALRDEGYLAE